MLEASRQRLQRELPADARVLDIGGWASPLARADWVIDHLPYETRGLYGQADGPERFSAESWVVHDICAREPFPFEDDAFDFVVCAHTLEDIRDPVWVCSEIARIGKAGYIECPSRLEEQSWGVQGPWVGWAHHHWLVDMRPEAIDFVFKYHVIHGRDSDHFPDGFHAELSDEEKVSTLWWEGSFEYSERQMESAEADEYLAAFVSAELDARGWRRGRRGWKRE